MTGQELYDLLRSEGLDVSKDDARTILIRANRLARKAVDDCNGLVNSFAQQWAARDLKKLHDMHLAGKLPAWKYGGDPRGFTVKLMFKSKKYNTWGGEEEGYGIA